MESVSWGYELFIGKVCKLTNTKLVRFCWFSCNDFWWKIREKTRKRHKFNMVQQIAYVHENMEEDFHYMLIRVT